MNEYKIADGIANIKNGDRVKVIFLPTLKKNGWAEKLWVEVIKIENGKITGVLDDEPGDPEELKVSFGSEVIFPQSSVIDITRI